MTTELKDLLKRSWYDATRTYQEGDMCMVHDGEIIMPLTGALYEQHVRRNTNPHMRKNEYEEFMDDAIETFKKEYTPVKKYCSCCGAPIRSLLHNCEYCGVVL